MCYNGDMPETIAHTDPFDDLMAREFGPATLSVSPDAAPVGFEHSVSLTPEEIDAAVAQFAAELSPHGDLTDDRFSAYDNEFLAQHGITSRNMTATELQAYEARTARVHQAMLASDLIVRSILGDIPVGDEKKKKSRQPSLVA